MSMQRRFRSHGCALVLTSLLLCTACSSDDQGEPQSPNADVRGSTTASATDPATTDPSAVPTGTPSTASLDSTGETCVQQAFSELSPAERAGQLVMVGVPAGNPARYRALVASKHLGSVFLAGRTSDSPSTIKKGVTRLPGHRTRTTTIGLLVAVDQEGGKVQSLRGGSWTTIPAATVQGEWSTGKLQTRTAAWVRQLRKAGVNMDLAPVADTVPAGTAAGNAPIGHFDRQYGSTPAQVSRSIRTLTSTMSDGDVIATIKHFPGLGRVKYNTDTSTKAVDGTTTADSAVLQPFRAGIEAGAGAVMVSSARYPKIDKKQPAVFSRAVITDLLRGRMGYQGVVMTDDVGKAVAVRSVAPGQRATRFIGAGGDLVLSVAPDSSRKMLTAIVSAANRYPGFRAQVNASTLRVLRLKQKFGLLTCSD
jgi:beta-N-acetylhexosaminidase